MRDANIAHTERARLLRESASNAERLLWGALRGRRLASYKFVRQAPIAPFYVDFLCRSKKLVIEVDGATHSTNEQISYDFRRDAYLRERGYQVVRVGNMDVYDNLNGVVETILVALETPRTRKPPTSPLPAPTARQVRSATNARGEG